MIFRGFQTSEEIDRSKLLGQKYAEVHAVFGTITLALLTTFFTLYTIALVVIVQQIVISYNVDNSTWIVKPLVISLAQG
jgi:hypothetical protein